MRVPPSWVSISLPARCDCGTLWRLTIDALYAHRAYACPACGAELEVRSYGPPRVSPPAREEQAR